VPLYWTEVEPGHFVRIARAAGQAAGQGEAA
jgi:hypothetical protein